MKHLPCGPMSQPGSIYWPLGLSSADVLIALREQACALSSDLTCNVTVLIYLAWSSLDINQENIDGIERSCALWVYGLVDRINQ